MISIVHIQYSSILGLTPVLVSSLSVTLVGHYFCVIISYLTGHRASLHLGWFHIVMLCVNNFLKYVNLLYNSKMAVSHTL